MVAVTNKYINKGNGVSLVKNDVIEENVIERKAQDIFKMMNEH